MSVRSVRELGQDRNARKENFRRCRKIGRTAIQRSIGEYGDFKENALGNTKSMKTGERICDEF